MRGWMRALALSVGLAFEASVCCGQGLIWQSPSPSGPEATA